MVKKKDVLQEEVVISEAYTTGIFWTKPDYYNFYPEEKLNTKTFLNDDWGFYFGLGRYMYGKGVTIFDDISVMKHINDLGLVKKFEQHGGFNKVNEIMIEVKDKEDNLDAYYSEIKKYNMLKKLRGMFGEKVVTNNGKYNYKKMDKEQLYIYWYDKFNQLGMDGDTKYDEFNLLDNLKEQIKNWNDNPAVGLPFYKSPHMTKICTGTDFGHVYIYGGFGGSGKTSFLYNKYVQSCIAEKEKLLIIANEQSIEEFRKMAVITAMGVGTGEYIRRQRLNEGEFTEDEIGKMERAVEWLEQVSEGDNSIIKFVFMENFIMEDVKKMIRYYANRGYRRILIDTGKPSEGKAQMQRWEVFTDDFKELYKLARPNGGGLNLNIFVTVQLSDTALTRRFLNEHALGESKKIKNEASVMMMGRFAWDSEYRGGKDAVKVTRWKKVDPSNPFYDGKEFIKEEVELERYDEHGNPNLYFFLFTPKNRRGLDNKTGQRILVFKVSFNNNTWYEYGWTTIHDDRNY